MFLGDKREKLILNTICLDDHTDQGMIKIPFLGAVLDYSKGSGINFARL